MCDADNERNKIRITTVAISSFVQYYRIDNRHLKNLSMSETLIVRIYRVRERTQFVRNLFCMYTQKHRLIEVLS